MISRSFNGAADSDKGETFRCTSNDVHSYTHLAVTPPRHSANRKTVCRMEILREAGAAYDNALGLCASLLAHNQRNYEGTCSSHVAVIT